jgi:hypothetical protein
VGTLGIGLIYAGMTAGMVLIAHALHLAHVRGNGVRLSEQQLPELYARCRAAATKLGLQETPDVYLLQSGGILNAFATKLLSRKYVIIYSSLVDGCQDPRQLDFVIGHELGHLAAGHLAWNAFLAPFHLLPWFGPAYSRAREYTCDRCGWDVVGDLEQSMRALTVLAGGGKLTGQVNLGAFMDQRGETGGFFMAIYELVSTHPFLCKRVAALKELSAPGQLKPVSRNFFAYPFAPVFGVAVGGASSMALLMVLYIGVVAAIAIPNFMKYQARSRSALTLLKDRQEQERALDTLQDPLDPAVDDEPLPDPSAPPSQVQPRKPGSPKHRSGARGQ